MHHVVLERWSRGSSLLHARDSRSKLAVLAVFLIAVSTTPAQSQTAFVAYALLLLIAAAVGRLPLMGLARRAAVVLPFSGTFAVVTWLEGEPVRALALAEKSLLSAMAALLLAATTPLHRVMRALEWMRVPRALVLVIQFLYRYLFVLSEQAQHMRIAARSRGGAKPARTLRPAAGAVAVLCARSWERAEGVHRAMLARGFAGHFPALDTARFASADLVFLCAAAAAVVLIRLAA